MLTPLLVGHLKRLRSGAPSELPEWEYLPGGWKDGAIDEKGWNNESVAGAQRDKWTHFVSLTEGNGPLGIAHEALLPSNQDIGAHATIMSFAYVAAIAARCKDSISMLDWGGGLGHYGVIARAILPGVMVDYHCKDVELLCSEGRNLISDFTFHELDSECFNRNYDLVIASSSLQYSKNWKDTFKLLANSARDWLYITRIPMISIEPSFVVMQRPYMHGYDTEYSGWFINRSDFLDYAGSIGLELVREFLVAESPHVPNAPERCQYGGFLFNQSLN